MDISFVDRRGKGSLQATLPGGTIAIILSNGIPELTPLSVREICRQIQRQAMNTLQNKPDFITLSKLEEALANGEITEAQFQILIGG